MRKLLRDKWFWAGVVVLLLWAAFSATFVYTPAIEGRVVDAETGKPIPNARVRVALLGSEFAIVDRAAATQGVSVATTHRNGRFSINASLQRLVIPLLDRADSRRVLVFAHGYTIGRPSESGLDSATVRLRRVEEDFEFLDHLEAVRSELDMAHSRISRLWPAIATSDDAWLRAEWRVFFRSFPGGPVTQTMRDRLEAGGAALEIKDGADSVILEAPDSEEARSARVWMKSVSDLTGGRISGKGLP